MGATLMGVVPEQAAPNSPFQATPFGLACGRA